MAEPSLTGKVAQVANSYIRIVKAGLVPVIRLDKLLVKRNTWVTLSIWEFAPLLQPFEKTPSITLGTSPLRIYIGLMCDMSVLEKGIRRCHCRNHFRKA